MGGREGQFATDRYRRSDDTDMIVGHILALQSEDKSIRVVENWHQLYVLKIYFLQ